MTRQGDTSTTHAVNWAVSGVGANPANAADFIGGVLPTGVVTLAPGQTSATVTILVRADGDVEPDEGFQVQLSDPSTGASLGTTTAVGTILDDDASPTGGSPSGIGNLFIDLGNGASLTASQDGSSGAYTIQYATGDVMQIFDRGSYLDVQFTADVSRGADDFEGILGDNDGDASNDIQLPDGAVLGTSPTKEQLYGPGGFGESWRVDVMSSLFDYPTGQGPDDFYDPNFPSYAVGLNSFPSALVQQALQQVEANGVTDPIQKESAALDLLLGGPNFQQSFAAGTQPGASTNAANVTNTGPDPVLIGATGPLTALPEGDAGTTPFVFNVFRIGDTSAALSLNYSVGGTVDADDFGGVLPTGTVDFLAGEDMVELTLNVSGDMVAEDDETLELVLSGLPTGAVLAGLAQGVVANDDVSYRIETADASKKEGQSGSTSFTFTVLRDGGASAGADSVSWSVAGSGGSPADAADFSGGVLPSGVLNFAAGETSKTITILIAGDALLEANEGFAVTLGAPDSGAPATNATAQGTIVNDDAVISIAPLDAVKPEGGQAEIPDAGPSGLAALATPAESSDKGPGGWGTGDPHYRTFDGLAYDFQGVGEYIFARSTGPDDVEVQVRTTPFGSSQTVSVHRGVATIVEGHRISIDNERGTALLIDGVATPLSEATPFTFQVTRQGDASVAHSVAWAVSGVGPNAASASDFVGGAIPSGVVTFNPGQTSAIVTVFVRADLDVEPDENFEVALSDPSTGASLGTAAALGAILDDDASPSGAPPSGVGNLFLDLGNGATLTASQNNDRGSYTIEYATGDILEVEDRGSYFDVRFFAEAARGPNSFEGLLGDLDGDASNDIQKSDGTVLGTNPTKEQLYGPNGFGESWRVGAMNSLFDYPAGQGPDDFYNPDFPAYAVSLGSFPTALVQQALQQVEANGVVDPILKQSAALDLLLGGPEFQQSYGAGVGLETPTTSAQVMNTGPDPVLIGATGPLAPVAEGDAGDTPFLFKVFRTGDTSAPLSLNYEVGGAVDADDFGGALPTGTVEFLAGEDMVELTLNVRGDTAIEADETVQLQVSGLPAGAVLAGLAQGIVANDDVAGPPPLNLVEQTPGAPSVNGTDGADLIRFAGGRSTIAFGGGEEDCFDFATLRGNGHRDFVTVMDFSEGESVKGFSPDDLFSVRALGNALQLIFAEDGDTLLFRGVSDLGQVVFADDVLM